LDLGLHAQKCLLQISQDLHKKKGPE
jgi:hypothetical protein